MTVTYLLIIIDAFGLARLHVCICSDFFLGFGLDGSIVRHLCPLGITPNVIHAESCITRETLPDITNQNILRKCDTFSFQEYSDYIGSFLCGERHGIFKNPGQELCFAFY
jgi:hypothetical protein